MSEKTGAFGKLPQILTFPLKEEGWFGKLAIAALVMVAGGIIPILPTIIILGYFYEMVRRIVVDGEDASLPKWDNWGEFLSNGFKWFASSLVISLPFVLIFIVMMALNFVPLFFLGENSNPDWMGAYFGLLFIMQFILIFASLIFLVFMGVFAPVYMTHMVAEGDFKSMFQIKQWWKIFSKGFWEFLISFLLMYGLGMIIYLIFFILLYSVVCCCLAPFFIGFGVVYLMAVYFALIASAYRDGRDKVPADSGSKPLPAGPSPEQESLPEPAVIEEFDLPSPDGEAAAVVAEAPVAVVEAIEAAAPVEPVVEDATMIEMPEVPEVPETPELDETRVSGVNQEVAAAMGFADATVKMDDLKKINGIGPKTAEVLNRAGIVNFEQLSKASVDSLKDILVAAGLEVVAAACTNWPQHAKDRL